MFTIHMQTGGGWNLRIQRRGTCIIAEVNGQSDGIMYGGNESIEFGIALIYFTFIKFTKIYTNYLRSQLFVKHDKL